MSTSVEIDVILTGGSKPTTTGSQRVPASKKSSSQEASRIESVSYKKEGQKNTGDGGEDPDENLNKKKVPEDLVYIEETDEEEEDNENNDYDENGEEITINLFGNLQKVVLTTPENIPDYPSSTTYHIRDNGFDKNVQYDRYTWQVVKEAENARKKKKTIFVEGIVGRKAMNILRCTKCEATKVIGATVRPTQNKKLMIRSIQYSLHDCNTVEVEACPEDNTDHDQRTRRNTDHHYLQDPNLNHQNFKPYSTTVHEVQALLTDDLAEEQAQRVQPIQQVLVAANQAQQILTTQQVPEDMNVSINCPIDIPSVDVEFGKINMFEENVDREVRQSRSYRKRKMRNKYLTPERIQLELEENHPVRIITGAESLELAESSSLLYEQFKSCELGKVPKSKNGYS